MPDHRRWLPSRPRTKRVLLFTIAGGALAVVLVGVALVYFVIFPTSSPAPFVLATPAPTAKGKAAASSSAQLAGRWTVAGSSAAGYRVRERLAFLPAASQAVGRTSSITGSATFTKSTSGATVAQASFVVDLSTLKSDRSMRDEKIRTIGLESERYPKATFVLSSPITLPASALTGQAVHVSATGRLMIHGTTKTETIPLALRVSGSEVEAVGSITFPWSEFNMTAPSVGGFVTVTSSATMEFELHLRHA
jgi:polyisoprenoid-binding protein YceI